MDGYKTRLYAIACRAPITEVHRSAVKKCPLYAQYTERRKLRDSRVAHVASLLQDHCKWDSEQGVMVRYKFSRFVLLDYNFRWDSLVEWVAVTSSRRDALAHELYMSYKQAHAALAYAGAIINTPEEYLTLSLPVNEDIPRAILALPEYAAQMQERIDRVFDEEELSSLEALVETIVQEDKEQKERKVGVVEKITTMTPTTVVKQVKKSYNNAFLIFLTSLGLLGLITYLAH